MTQNGPKHRRYSILLLVIVVIAITLRLYSFRGFSAVDDAEYARFAHQITQGTFTLGAYNGPAVFPLRLGIIFPTSLLFRFFGVSEWTMVFYPFFLSIVSVLLAYVCTKHFFGHRAALIAAAVWALLPIEALHATILIPDPPAAFFASLGVTCILILIGFRTEHKLPLLFGGIVAGISFGVSWLCKETVVYLVPFCAVLVVITLKKDWKRNIVIWTGVAVGSLGILLAEMYVYHNLTGDWLFHFHEIERNYLQNKQAFFTEGSSVGWPVGGSYLKALAKRLFLVGPFTIFLGSQFLLLPLFGVLAAFHALYWKDKTFFIPGLWLITLVLMFNFSSSSLSSYRPLVLFERYLYHIFLPATVLLSGFFENLLFHKNERRHSTLYRERFFWGVLLIVFTALIAGYNNYKISKWYSGWVSEVRNISSFLKPSDRVYTDILSIQGLEFFWHYPEKMNTINFEDMESSEEIQSESFVLINLKYLDWLNGKAGWWPTKSLEYRSPEFCKQAPLSWNKIWQNGNASLYCVK